MKKSVNQKVVHSIGVSVLAAMTTCTNVYASYDGIPETDAAKGDTTRTEEAAAGGTDCRLTGKQRHSQVITKTEHPTVECEVFQIE